MPRRLPLVLGWLLAGLLALACGREPSPPPRPLLAPSQEETRTLEDGVHVRRTVVTRSYALAPWRVAVHAEPFRIQPLDMSKDAWILAWSSNTEDPHGAREPDDIHCHATLSVGDIYSDMAPFLGIYTDGFTPRFELPPGFGVRIAAGTRLVFQPMFNNRRPDARKSRMRLEVDYVRGEEAERLGLRELSGFAVSVTQPELFWVEPGETDEREHVFDMPVTGRVHAIGAHLHPYGEWVELRRERDREIVFRAVMEHAEDLGDYRLPTYASADGFYVQSGERYRLASLYMNDSRDRIDAMAGIFVFYDPEGKPGP